MVPARNVAAARRRNRVEDRMFRIISKRKASWTQFVQKVPPASEFAPNGGDMGTAAELDNAVRRPHPVFPPAKPGISYRP